MRPDGGQGSKANPIKVEGMGAVHGIQLEQIIATS